MASSSGKDNYPEVLGEPAVPDDDVVKIDIETSTFAGTERFEYLITCVRLHQAALKGDWQDAEILAREHPDLLRRPITEGGETALHIAVAAKRADFVKELVKRMTSAEIALLNKAGSTALFFAAISGMVLIAVEMVKKNPELPLIRSNGMTPLYVAALNRRRKMVSYLYHVTSFELLTADDRIDILVATISIDMFDIALKILKSDPTLATREDSDGRTALKELAGKPIGSRSWISAWERRLNSC